MNRSFLGREAKSAVRRMRRILFITTIAYYSLAAIITYALKDSISSDGNSHNLVEIFSVLTLVVLIGVVIGTINTIRIALNANNMIIPYKGDTKAAAGSIIDREAAEGQFLVDEYISVFPEGKKPRGERVILTPTYLLLCSGTGKIKAIPREKIYWLCAQVGRKGSSSFVVRLLIFTENKSYYVNGVDVDHIEKLAEKLYAYIPNVFSEYDPFIISYQLDMLFDKDRQAFVELYESEKNKAVGGAESHL